MVKDPWMALVSLRSGRQVLDAIQQPLQSWWHHGHLAPGPSQLPPVGHGADPTGEVPTLGQQLPPGNPGQKWAENFPSLSIPLGKTVLILLYFLEYHFDDGLQEK